MRKVIVWNMVTLDGSSKDRSPGRDPRDTRRQSQEVNPLTAHPWRSGNSSPCQSDTWRSFRRRNTPTNQGIRNVAGAVNRRFGHCGLRPAIMAVVSSAKGLSPVRRSTVICRGVCGLCLYRTIFSMLDRAG